MRRSSSVSFCVFLGFAVKTWSKVTRRWLVDDKSVLPTANPEYANIESARRGTQIAESGNIFLVDSPNISLVDSSDVLEAITMKIWICMLRTG